MKIFLLSIFLILLCSCATTQSSSKYPSNSLGGNSAIPDKNLIGFYGRKQWKEMRNIPYDGYIVMSGSVDRHENFHIDEIKEAYPDDSRNKIALQFANGIKASNLNAGSRIKARIRVYVVFYETFSSPNRAIVFTHKSGTSAPTESIGGSSYIRIWTY
ncbi:MAG: hypothetical protein MI748_01475 [Opitutales bacterium]|nr:hypothetical protein [Opitutales bacterium]